MFVNNWSSDASLKSIKNYEMSQIMFFLPEGSLVSNDLAGRVSRAGQGGLRIVLKGDFLFFYELA